MKRKIILVLLFATCACSSTQVNQAIDEASKALESGSAPTSAEVGEGLKEALIKGISAGTSQVSQTDGYFRNLAIKIPFPPELKKMEQKLRQLGFGKEVDNFVMTMNRGAEDAAKEVKPIFAHVDFEKHMPHMISFWEFVLLDKEGYTTNVFDKHVNLPLKEEHFTIWLDAFEKTVHHLFAGEKAEMAIQRAQTIAYSFQTKMKQMGKLR